MFQFLQVLSVVLVAIGMAMSLAHALELPGKLRLSRDHYIAAQAIYYPGFTIGGFFGEFGAMLATLALLVVTPTGTPRFWLTALAFACLLTMHALYWALTHPVNRFWLKDQALHGAGAAFFDAGIAGAPGADQDWTKLRDRWEYSHVARAAFAMAAFILLVIAATLRA